MGDSVFDEATGGGILRSGITEISGEAGSGKTQFCISLTLQNILQQNKNIGPISNSGAFRKSAYLSCGEGEFPIQRLSQIASIIENSSNQSTPGLSRQQLLDNVLIEKCHNVEDILDSVTNKLPDMCREDNVSFVCIDSIGGLARNEFDPVHKAQMFERTQLLLKLSQKLKWLSDTFNVCIVVANQVSSSFDVDSASVAMNPLGNAGIVVGKDGLLLMDGAVTPALGLVWAHCVNARIILSRQSSALRRTILNYDNVDHAHVTDDNDIVTGLDNNVTTLATASSASRVMFLQFSPAAPMSLTSYQITNAGPVGISYNHIQA